MENPPPYTPGPDWSGTIRSRHTAAPPPLPERKTTVPLASVSRVHLFSKHESITGTFHIDPSTPGHGEGPTLHTRCGRWKKGKGKGKKKGVAEAGPHASFQTRSGDIKLHLGTTLGTDAPAEREERANIFVGSRKGKVEVTLLPRDATPPEGMTTKQPFIGLDVFSRSGDVTVYLPETFSGVVRVESVKGEMRFLPTLAGGMRVLKSTGQETMFTLGDGQGDLCEVFTRKGQIVLGVAGRDVLKEEVGFWRKLFGH
ncbi:hypothetical protein AN958_07041 [Leucoagaricus sp. SymC.cos]|nr:hypothetical protein AN958_07041 [Leucoagaricus sp. SymC.cos]